MNQLPPIAQRGMRVQTAVALQTPDRVPFVPTWNNFYQLEYGVTIEDSMRDPLTVTDALNKVLDRYEPDLVYMPTTFPCQAMESAGATAARWPGEYLKLPPNTPYQYIDKQYLPDEDYDEFLKDPSRYIIQKILPQKYSNYAGLALINPVSLCNQAIYSQAAFGLPPVRQALQAMLDTGAHVMENLDKCAKLSMDAVERGFIPFGGAVCMTPFDEFADHVRGIMEACMDCIEEPERLAQAVEMWGEQHIPAAIANAKMQHAQYLFVPLHCGTDDFMSLENYRKFYWPGLLKVINAAVAAEMTPIIMCEGKYHTRLEVLAEAPKGKVIYCFEDTDFVKAKKILGGVACIACGMPTEYLMMGDKQRVIDHTKKMIDLLAPGGGYIMTNSTAIDQVKTENLEAWKDTVFEYGRY